MAAGGLILAGGALGVMVHPGVAHDGRKAADRAAITSLNINPSCMGQDANMRLRPREVGWTTFRGGLCLRAGNRTKWLEACLGALEIRP